MGRGRPQKRIAEWFPHYTSSSSGATIHILEDKFGNDGYAFWFKMLELLGVSDGLYLDCNRDEIWLWLVYRAKVDEAKAEEILNLLARTNAIDKELWTEHKIIWIQNFVDELASLFDKRKSGVPLRPDFSDSGKPDRKVDQQEDRKETATEQPKEHKDSKPSGFFTGLGSELTDEDYARMRELDDIEQVWRNASGSGFTPQESAEMAELLYKYPADEVTRAIIKAGRMRKVYVGYVIGILENGGGKEDDRNRGSGGRASQSWGYQRSDSPQAARASDYSWVNTGTIL